MEAALYADKVRINPGNFADAKVFAVKEYTDEEYLAELERIEEKFRPVVLRCKERGISMRIGTNHGSLSDRIMNRFGDTPEGMVESAIEFAAICRKYDYHELIFSMKASNPKVMILAYRLLAARMAELVAMTVVRSHLHTMARINVHYDLLPRESDILHLKFWDYAFKQLREKQAIFFEKEGKNAGCWVMHLETEGDDGTFADAIEHRINRDPSRSSST